MILKKFQRYTVPEAEKAAIIADYEAGFTYDALCLKYDYERGRIQGIVTRSPMYGHRTVGQHAFHTTGDKSLALSYEMAEMRKNMTLQEIGDHFDMTREAVRLRLVRIGAENVVSHITCEDCGEVIPRGTLIEHRKRTHVRERLSSGHWTPEVEMRYEAIAEAYRTGMRIADISRTFRTTTDRPSTYGRIYYILRKMGIEPSRGGGHYKRDAHSRAAYRASVVGKPKDHPRKPVHGWRADE